MAPAIVRATLQATFLSALSNILAQAIQAYRSSRPFVLDTAPITNFVIFTFLSVPPNFLWQEYLEDTFPGQTVTPIAVSSHEKAPAPEDSEKPKELLPEKKLNVTNTLIKFGLDQTIGCFINTIIFIAAMSALKGADKHMIIQSVRNDTWPLMFAGYKLWPMVSILSFTVIPVQQRVVFGSLIGVGWGIFLSIFVSR